MMRIFRLMDPRDFKYAQAGQRGAWTEGSLCPECERFTGRLVSPQILEWMPGSDVIGDFTWPGLCVPIVVSNRVRQALEPRFRCDFEPIEMKQDPKLKRPKRITTRTKPRVWLPYEGPHLWKLVPLGEARLDREASNWTLEMTCSTCGYEPWYPPTSLNPDARSETVVDKSTWTGHEIFVILESGCVFCVEELKDFVESQGFTNMGFREDGWISD